MIYDFGGPVLKKNTSFLLIWNLSMNDCYRNYFYFYFQALKRNVEWTNKALGGGGSTIKITIFYVCRL